MGPRYARASASWAYGMWMIRLWGRFFQLKAPWWHALFSERYRYGVKVIPLGFGWRITIRTIDTALKESTHD